MFPKRKPLAEDFECTEVSIDGETKPVWRSGSGPDAIMPLSTGRSDVPTQPLSRGAFEAGQAYPPSSRRRREFSRLPPQLTGFTGVLEA